MIRVWNHTCDFKSNSRWALDRFQSHAKRNACYENAICSFFFPFSSPFCACDPDCIEAIENVFRVCIAWYKHERGWENSRQLCKPETTSRVCITVENCQTLLFRTLKLVRVISPCFAKQMLSKIRVVFSLKMSAQAKKDWHSMFLKIFQVSADEEMGE